MSSLYGILEGDICEKEKIKQFKIEESGSRSNAGLLEEECFTQSVRS